MNHDRFSGNMLILYIERLIENGKNLHKKTHNGMINKRSYFLLCFIKYFLILLLYYIT
jgi:hypothetical protein